LQFTIRSGRPRPREPGAAVRAAPAPPGRAVGPGL